MKIMEQIIIEEQTFKEDELIQLAKTLEKFIANNNNNKNTRAKSNRKRHYHSWTIDERTLIIRTALKNGYNNKQIKWKKVAAELNNGCSADACKAYYHRVLRQPLLHAYRVYKLCLMSNNEEHVIKDADLNEQINNLTNLYKSFFEKTKTSNKTNKKLPEK